MIAKILLHWDIKWRDQGWVQKKHFFTPQLFLWSNPRSGVKAVEVTCHFNTCWLTFQLQKSFCLPILLVASKKKTVILAIADQVFPLEEGTVSFTEQRLIKFQKLKVCGYRHLNSWNKLTIFQIRLYHLLCNTVHFTGMLFKGFCCNSYLGELRKTM